MLIVTGCGTSQQQDLAGKPPVLQENPPFTVADAYYQEWVAGIKEGGKGVNVHLKFETVEAEVEVTAIYFRRRSTEAIITSLKPLTCVGYFTEHTENDVIMSDDPKEEASNSMREPFPFQLASNEAVVRYRKQGIEQFYKIENLERKEMLAYPQGNPNND
jgi:hypothetical protein